MAATRRNSVARTFGRVSSRRNAIKNGFGYVLRARRRSSVDDAFTAMVTVVQRFDSALRLNVHFHMLVLEGLREK